MWRSERRSDASARMLVLPAPIEPVMISKDSVDPPSRFNHFKCREQVRSGNLETDSLPTPLCPISNTHNAMAVEPPRPRNENAKCDNARPCNGSHTGRRPAEAV